MADINKNKEGKGRIIVVFILSLVIHISMFNIQPMSAQSFRSLWKQVRTAEEKDLPKSALTAIEKIERKAEKQRDYGNLLAALMKEIAVQREIAPDSLNAAKTRLMARQTQWRVTGHGVEAVLADVAMEQFSRFSSQVSLLDSLLASPDSALYRQSQKAHEYAPFIENGEDSRYFNNDLLSLIILSNDIGKKTTDLLEKYYGKDNKIVAWRRTEEAINKERNVEKKIALIDKALAEWKGWKEINEVQNQRIELTLPQYRASIKERVVTQSEDVWLFFTNVRNIPLLKITLTNDKGITRTYTHKFESKKEWEYIKKDSVNLGHLSYGRWTTTISGGEIDVEQDNLYVTDMKVIEMALPDDQLRVVVVDASTGSPVAGAMIYCKKRSDNELATPNGITDKNGEFIIDKKRIGIYGNDYYIRATRGDDTAMPLSAVWTNYSADKAEKVQNHLNLYTDRAIYRRGQVVRVSVLCHTVLDGKETIPSSREKVILSLRDRKYKEVEQKAVVTDDYGTATADFLIPEEGENGYYCIEGNGSVRNIVSFNVEDYKRPTFDVSLDIDENQMQDDVKDTIIVKGTVKMYSGVPVANAKVVYEVKRTQYFRYDNSILLRDTLYTDADGLFYARMPMPLPKDADETWYYCYQYILKAEVTDNTGESHSQVITRKRENNSPVKPQLQEKPKPVRASAENFNEKNDPVTIYIVPESPAGSEGNDYHAYYTLCAGNCVMDKGRIDFRDSTTYSLSYREEYGDGVTFSVAWVKDGNMMSYNVHVKKFLPSKELTMEWGTFRDKLYPGQNETWTLKLRNLDGTPSKAQVMAVMYDQSLDALASHKWSFNDYRSLYLPAMSWNTGGISSCSFRGQKRKIVYEYKNLLFNKIADEFIYGSQSLFYLSRPMKLYEGKGVVVEAMSKDMGAMRMMAKTNETISSLNVMSDNVVTVGYGASGNDADGADVVIPMRSDFSETAFFLPQVLTDKNGVATLRFTMPETVTTWHFMALAHDKEMRYAMMDTTTLTQKKVMVQPKMPRFLRVGDKATISASIANMMNKNQKVTVNFIVKNARTEKVLHRDSKTVMTEAGRTAVALFAYYVKDEDDLIWSFTAQVPGFSDGEQHLLPVLTEKELQPDTASIVINPRKMLMEALPALQVPKSNNAVTLAHAIYANVVGAKLNDTIVSPANDNVLAQLVNLQNADGGFAWYNRMRSNKYVTIEVLKTLARLNLMCGKQENTEYIMERAFSFAKSAMEKEVSDMKKHNVKYLSSTALDWLYTLGISDKSGGSAENFFRKMIYDETKYDDMHTKAVSAITLNGDGKKKKAAEFVESIKQHTVYRADMGRYFDTYRAAYSWCSYRIPTQTMCIEAIKDVTPEDQQTISEMQRWIVSAKRTQRWDNPINTINALYALHDVKDSAMLASYTVRPEDIQGALTVSRELSAKKLKVGDKVKVKLTIKADRDYDFVTITDNRPACLEPVNQMSGYSWYGFWGCYAEMRDSKSVYHLDKMAKGTHVIETEYYVNRTGEYHSGNATVVCEYAPEFRGSTDAISIKIQ